MRIESSVTSLSWIPSEAVTGPLRLPMDFGVGLHYDDPPPDVLTDLEALHRQSRFRFANVLRAWVEVDENGGITGCGQAGGGFISKTVLRLGGREVPIPPVGFPDLRPDPERADRSVRFVQTTGGRAGVPYPRRVSKPPYVQIISPTVWTTLALVLHADGRVEHEVVGASPFPRHWVYDDTGQVVAKSGTADFKRWGYEVFGTRNPWGDTQTPALVTAAESAAERQLSTLIMRSGEKPTFRKLAAGEALTRQGEEAHELFLVLDGVLDVSVDDEVVAEIGPGAIVGERSLLEGGRRTSTVRARTPVRVAQAAEGQLDHGALADVAESHRREET